MIHQVGGTKEAVALAVTTGLAHGAFSFNDPLVPAAHAGLCSIRFANGTQLGSAEFGKNKFKGITCRSIGDLAAFLDALVPLEKNEASFTQLYKNSLLFHLYEAKIAFEHLKNTSWFYSNYQFAMDQLEIHCTLKNFGDKLERNYTLEEVFQSNYPLDLFIRCPLHSEIYSKSQQDTGMYNTSAKCSWNKYPSMVLHVDIIYTDSNRISSYFPIPFAIQLIGPASTSVHGVRQLFKLACSVSKIFPNQLVPVFNVL